jgi:hypothetical protein
VLSALESTTRFSVSACAESIEKSLHASFGLHCYPRKHTWRLIPRQFHEKAKKNIQQTQQFIMGKSMKDKKPFYQPLVDVLTHVVIGTLMFCIIAIPAVLLSFLVHWLETLGVSSYSIQLLTLLEHGILTVDVLSVFFYIVTMVYSHFKGSNDE